MNKLLIVLTVVFVLGMGFVFIFNQGRETREPIGGKVASEKRAIAGYSGNVLAGNASPFLEFNKSDYEKALSSEKIILLNFYANWCPICKVEEPIIKEGFDSLTEDKIIGFRVNFNDTDTDNDEKQLAKEFNIPYQHTKIFIKNGQEISRSVDQWDKNKFIEEIEKIIEN